MNPGCRVQDQLNAGKPTAPYIIGGELNLRKLPGRQSESNSQPSEQLRPMTIKTSASTETATTAHISRVTFYKKIDRRPLTSNGTYSSHRINKIRKFTVSIRCVQVFGLYRHVHLLN